MATISCEWRRLTGDKGKGVMVGGGVPDEMVVVGGPRVRGTLLFPVLLTVAFFAAAVRLFQLQVLEHGKYASKAVRQLFGVTRERDRRGSIIDAKGRMLAVSVEAKACALDPKVFFEAEGANPEKLLARLTAILNLKPAEHKRLADGLAKRRIIPNSKGNEGSLAEPIRFVWVRRRLSNEEWSNLSSAMAAARLEASNAWRNRRLWLRKAGEFKVAWNKAGQSLAVNAADGWRKVAVEAEGRFAGVFFPPEYRRIYPNGSLAAHVLGFGDIDGHGIVGVEKVFQAILEGIPLDRMVARDARARSLSALVSDNRTTDGMTVELTLDSAVQAMVEEELRLGVERLRNESPEVAAHAVVMDPFTGGIIAIANYPTFDPNRPGEFQPRTHWNDAVASVQEPGSTFKPIMLSASIEEGLADFDEEIDCSTYQMANRRTIKDIRPFGRMSLLMALTKSSNPAMVRVAQRLGPERMRQYVVKYGFGESTGSFLPNEENGRVTSAANWSSYTMGSVPMGYEINVTTLQMAAAYSVIANGGLLLRSRIIAAIRDPSGRTSMRFDPEVRRRVISPKTAALMRGALRKVITEGTGKRANLDEYELGGKTGTAEMMANARERAAGARAYSKIRHTANFVALAPWNRPRLVICVSIRDTTKYGGEASSPVGAAIARRALAYLGEPTRNGAAIGMELVQGVDSNPKPPSAIYTVGASDDENAQSEEVDPRLWDEWIEDEDAIG
jgi:cell division protein FtsI (penicillin-binding protein 3)